MKRKSEKKQKSAPEPSTAGAGEPSAGEAAPAPPPRTPEQSRMALRRLVEIFYDIQRLRLQTGGRTLARPETAAIVLHEHDQIILDARKKELLRTEKSALADVEAHLQTIPFFVKVLSDKKRYRGIGPTMAGVILAHFDIKRENTVSQMWAFAGLRPIPCKRCKKCQSPVVPADGMAVDNPSVSRWVHTKERPRGPVSEAAPKLPKCEYAGRELFEHDVFDSAKAQKPVKGERLPYNAFLRAKLCGVLAPILIKCGSPWRKCYDDYKAHKASVGWGRSDAHRHVAAQRYMIKMLLLDIWKEWRTFEGLDARAPYREEKLGMPPHSSTVAASPAPAPDRRTVDDAWREAEIEAEMENI